MDQVISQRYSLIANNRLVWHTNLFLSVCIVSLHFCQSQRVVTEKKLPPIVETKYGKLHGGYFSTKEGQQVYAFRGVPYARPPLGKYRFQPPQPLDSWANMRVAITPKEECILINHPLLKKKKNDFISGSEDCLYMDIYTPSIYDKNAGNPYFNPLYPVLVNIHGGTIAQGRDFTPVYLLDKFPAVFVHVNYRQGPFGFLSTESSDVPGNMGLKDQVAALQWINENIKLFNGNASQITLIGFSAGGASVHYHYLSYMSRDLFSRGISMSGTALCPWALMERGLEKTQALVDALGCRREKYADFFTGYLIEEQIECLRQKSARQILNKVQELFHPWIYSPFSPFGPTLEINNVQPFLDENPYDIIRLGKAKNAPWLTSVVSQEGLFPIGHIISNDTMMEKLSANWVKVAPNLLDYKDTTLPEFQRNISRTIQKNFLTKFVIINGKVNPTFQLNVIDVFSNRHFNAYCSKAAKMHAKFYSSDVYFYIFSYRGRVSLSKDLTGLDDILGASHGDDMIYTLGAFYGNFSRRSEEYNMVRKMQKMLKTFMLSGKPRLTKITETNLWNPVRKVCPGLNLLAIEGPTKLRNTQIKDLGFFSYWMSLNIDETLAFKLDRFYSPQMELETTTPNIFNTEIVNPDFYVTVKPPHNIFSP